MQAVWRGHVNVTARTHYHRPTELAHAVDHDQDDRDRSLHLAIDLGKYKSLAEAVRFASITSSRA